MASKRQPRKASPKKKAPANIRKAAPAAAGKRVDTDAAVKWYRERRPLYQSLCEKVAGIVEEVLKADGVDYHSVENRAKELDSYEKKAERYEDATTEIHDLAGVRVIAYVESESRRIAAKVRELFDVDTSLSEDKSMELGVDKVGYRSDHYVATLPAARCRLPEFTKFKGMKFEVQVRTILQHAWAEIEHDRNYKFTGVLPPEIQRRFALLAGALEMADREFDRIAAEIDTYTDEVAGKTAAGELDIPIDTISLREYLLERFASGVDSGTLEPTFGSAEGGARELVRELATFGVSTLAELDRLIPDRFEGEVSSIEAGESTGNFMSLVRLILVISDADRYFKESWQGSSWKYLTARSERHWRAFGVDVDILAKKYGLELSED